MEGKVGSRRNRELNYVLKKDPIYFVIFTKKIVAVLLRTAPIFLCSMPRIWGLF